MTMAVLEANGKPIPAAPDPKPAPTLSETPRETFPIFSGGKTSSRRPVRVRRDPGTLSHVPLPTHRHHGIPPSSHDVSTANQPPTLPFEPRRKSAQQQQFINDHRRRSTPHQHQTKGRHHTTHAHRTTLTNRPELHKEKSQENNVNSLFHSIYTRDNQLQHAMTTDFPDCFTPIVRDSCKNYPQANSTTRSPNSKISTRTTDQQQITQNDHDRFTPSATTDLPACQTITRTHRNGNKHHHPPCHNQTHTSEPHKKSDLISTLLTIRTLTSEKGGSNITASNLLATPPHPTKHRIVRVRRKDDTAKPRHQTQLCTPLSTATTPVTPRSTSWTGQATVNPMQQPNLNSTPAHRPPDYTIASNCHTHDAQPPALQKNPPTGPKSTNPTATNDQQRNANNTTPESPDSEGCPPSGKSSRTAATQSLSAQRMTTTTTQHHTTPYSRAYRYTSFLNTHDTRVLYTVVNLAPPNSIQSSPGTLLPTVGTTYDTSTKPSVTVPIRRYQIHSEQFQGNSAQRRYEYQGTNSPSTRLTHLVSEPCTDHLLHTRRWQAWTSMASTYQVFARTHTNSQHRPIDRPYSHQA